MAPILFSVKRDTNLLMTKTKENIFFESNNATEMLKKGNLVSFEDDQSPKLLSAVDLKVI
ncbi:hypothetical protein RCH13_000232 [Chryseobacterium sp. MP_3.2]|nr:hypothetical protein [Chryseobacterium sp. MP_3.2]